MLAADIPTKFVIPFANAPDAGTSRVVPQAPPVEVGAASLQKGFSETNMLPIASGGVPPFGQDFNGLLNQITGWNRWISAGGAVKYDSTFQTAIGGYPSGAFVQSATQPGLWWLSTTDNNATDPDAAGAGWAPYRHQPFAASTGGSADAITATFAPALLALADGQVVRLRAASTNTSSVTLNTNGLGAVAVRRTNNASLSAGEIIAGAILTLCYDATNTCWQLGGGGASASPFGQVISTNTTMASGVWYRCDASAAARTVTLPAGPVAGDIVRITDIYGYFDAFPWTVGRNSQTIMGIAANMVLNVRGADMLLQFNGSDWRLF